MSVRYCIEITEGTSPDYCFTYFDTADHLADHLFSYLKVFKKTEMEFSNGENDYRVIIARIHREGRASFLRVIDLLPALMAYAGYTDYDEYCRNFLLDAQDCLVTQQWKGSTAVQ